MSHSIAIPDHRMDHRFGSVFLGLIIAALGCAIVGTAVDVVRGTIGEHRAITEPLVEYPASELSREWRWKRKTVVEPDRMYRQKASPGIDWIRRGGALATPVL